MTRFCGRLYLSEEQTIYHEMIFKADQTLFQALLQ